jgi:hypothetical protein
MTIPPETERGLLRDAQAVVDAVTMDDSGMLVGTIWQGGNGGMLSRETLKAVDKLRKTIAEVKAGDLGIAAIEAERMEK